MPDSTPIFAKILVAITEDWFLLSHFRPLIAELRQLAREVVVVTRDSGRLAEVQSLGVRTIELNYNRSSMHPVREAATIRQFTRILRDEQPDVLHLIAMKPIVLGGVASALARVPHTIVHMTGLGFLAISPTAKARAARLVALAILRRVIARPSSWLVVENPEDLAFLKDGGVAPAHRVTILGGAGIDPEAFPELPEPAGDMPIAAFVGRMILPKGVDVLMEAAALLKARGVPLAIELYGRSDDGNLEAIPSSVLKSWSDGERTRWLGFTSDVAAIWRRAAIFVLPARSREGMPRSLLEAAASARPLIVTDVPGCRHFVRPGVEGLIVPPADAKALADALEKLARDPALRRKLGLAARARVLDGYTEADVRAGLARTYRSLVPSTHS
ncbi:MAG: glycosyltransferase family 4 protein [Hyphomicrobiaceae bacterium]